jgi:hypothetical protein
VEIRRQLVSIQAIFQIKRKVERLEWIAEGLERAIRNSRKVFLSLASHVLTKA